MTEVQQPPAMELLQLYQKQFQTTVEHIRRGAIAIGDLTAAKTKETRAQLHKARRDVEPQVRQMQHHLASSRPIAAPADLHRVLETYLWTTVCLVGLAVGQTTGGLLSSALGVVLNGWCAVALCYVLVPVYAYYLCVKRGDATDVDRRMLLLAAATSAGLLSGHLHADQVSTALLATPPPCVLTAVMAVLAVTPLGAKTAAPDRRVYVATTTAVTVCAALLLAWPVAVISPKYLACTVVLSTGYAIHLQLLLGVVSDGTANVIQAQFAAVVGSLLAGDVLTVLFAGDQTIDTDN